MAVENIVIELSADATKLQPVIDQLVKLGQVSAKDAEEFKKITAETQKLTTETVKAAEAVKQSATAQTSASAAKLAALEKEAAKLKELQALSGKAADTASAKRFSDAIKESENRIKGLNAELIKTPKHVKDADTGFKSLRTQLLEARNEAVRLAEKFGEFSPQAIAAANAAAKIDDKVKDLNRTIAALNPEQKLGAFLQIGVGISGAFTAAQGAMALFGSESEDVQKALLKVQGALALTQGLQSVLGLKDAFRDLRILLGITSVAQNALTASTVAGSTATSGAAVATRAFTAALAANPITAVVVALGLLVTALVALDVGLETSKESLEEYNAFLEKTKKAEEALIDALEGQRAVSPTIRNLQRQIEVAEALGVKESDLLKLQLALNRAQDAYNDVILKTALQSGPTYNKYLQDNLDLANKREIIQQKLNEALKAEQRSTNVQKVPTLDIDVDEFIAKLEQADTFQDDLAKKNEDRLKRGAEIEREVRINLQQKIAKEELEIRQELNKQLQELGIQSVEFLFDSIQNQFDANIQNLEDLKQARLESFDEELENLDELNKNKILSDGAYIQQKKKLEKEREQAEKDVNKRIAEEKRKAFLADRTASIAKVAIDTALSISKTSAQLGFPAAIPFIAIAAATGALQLAAILSQPIPKFKKGVLDLQGIGTGESDSIPAMLSKGESVMTAKETKLFMPTLSAIRKNLIPAEVMNRFVIEGGSKVEAYIDTNLLNRANKRILPQQAELIGKSVAKYLNKGNPIYSHIRKEWID